MGKEYRLYSEKVGVSGMLEWVAWVACLRGWRAYVGGVSGALTWLACYYYCYCYYWNTILKKKMLNVYFWNNEKMFQIDLKRDLKEEPNLKSRYCFTLLETGKTTICLTGIYIPSNFWIYQDSEYAILF